MHGQAMKKIPLYGLRFYPASVTTRNFEGVPFIMHGSVSEKYSDFHLIFRSLYPLWQDKFLLRWKNVLGGEHEGLPSKDAYDSLVVWDSEKTMVCAFSAKALDLIGMSMPDEHTLLIYDSPPPGSMTWQKLYDFSSGGKKKHKRNRWRENLHCILHNHDGIYWELFTVDEQECIKLRERHCQNAALRMCPVDFYEDLYT